MAGIRGKKTVAVALLAAVVGTVSACSGDDGDDKAKSAGGGGKADKPVAAVGQPFDLLIDNIDEKAAFKVTTENVQVGAPLDEATRKAFPDMPANPQAGRQWVVVKFSVTNTGDKQAFWTPNAATVDVGAKNYAMDDPSKTVTNEYNSFLLNGGQTPTSAFDGINPGITGTTYGVWQIPTGAKPTALTIPRSSGVSWNADTPTLTVSIP